MFEGLEVMMSTHGILKEGTLGSWNRRLDRKHMAFEV
jgi:hypothetical protein